MRIAPAASLQFWPQLPLELVERVAEHLEANEVACSLRLMNKAAAAQLHGPRHTTIRLSQPVPADAFARQWLAPGATRRLNLQQRRELLCLTAASGSVPNLEVAVRAAGCLPDFDTFKGAAGAGCLASCQWLHQQGCPLGDVKPQSGGEVLNAAAAGGHMHVCEWLMTLDFRWFWGAEEAAVQGAHLALAEWLLQRRSQLRYEWTPSDGLGRTRLVAAVAKGCDLPTLQRLWARWGELGEDRKADVRAAAAGSPTPDWAAKVEWLEGQGGSRTEDVAAKAAARSDALERLAWLRGRGYPLARSAVVNAAANGNTAALQYLFGEGVQPEPGNTVAAAFAAGGGHLPALQALHAAGWPVHGSEAQLAAQAGHLHVVAWLVEALGAGLLGCGLFTAAAYSGSVELMAWLRQRGCEWDAYALDSAAESGCEEALEWLVAQGCPVSDRGYSYTYACREGDLATMRCLRRLGVPWGDPNRLVSDAMRHPYNMPVLRWLLEAGCPADFGAAAAEMAAMATRQPHLMNDATEVAQLLTQHRQERERQAVA